KLQISDEASSAAANLAARYVTDRFMTDTAIDLVDEAASRVRMQRSATPSGIKESMAALLALQTELEDAVNSRAFEEAAELRDRERKLRDRIEKDQRERKEEQESEEVYVTEQDIAEVVAM